jgi:hypothetical protein
VLSRFEVRFSSSVNLAVLGAREDFLPRVGVVWGSASPGEMAGGVIWRRVASLWGAIEGEVVAVPMGTEDVYEVRAVDALSSDDTDEGE